MNFCGQCNAFKNSLNETITTDASPCFIVYFSSSFGESLRSKVVLWGWGQDVYFSSLFDVMRVRQVFSLNIFKKCAKISSLFSLLHDAILVQWRKSHCNINSFQISRWLIERSSSITSALFSLILVSWNSRECSICAKNNGKIL